MYLVANNMRFLIVPWVEVAHLAAMILGRIARRISADWQAKYAHPLALLETTWAQPQRPIQTLERPRQIGLALSAELDFRTRLLNGQ